MRYFLSGLVLAVIAVVAVMGFRGSVSRKPSLEFFDDMDRQLKLRPQTEVNIGSGEFSSRLPVAGTIARGNPQRVGNENVWSFEDKPVNTGRIPGSTNYVETIPMEVNERVLERGRERYAISCLPCHGAQADGNGITKKFGMGIVANLHDARIVRMTDGELFHVITHGRGLMGPYGPTVDINDRWAIISYLRALQLTRLGAGEDVPPNLRANFSK